MTFRCILNSDRNPKILACEFCPMRFSALGTLKNHRRTHTGEKPFVCKYCDRAFAQKSDCVTHMRTHTKEKPYTCTLCGSSFSKSGTLKSHLRNHNKEDEKQKSNDKSQVRIVRKSKRVQNMNNPASMAVNAYRTPDELSEEILQR